MNEPGPFIMLGNMDSGDERAYRFALEHPESVRAVVPIGYSAVSEFQSLANFYNWTEEVKMANYQSTSLYRMHVGNFYNFFGVSWGVIQYFIPNGDYQPSDRAYESHFLNDFNEKQWTTQTVVLKQGSEGNTATISAGYTLWYTNTSLSPSIPVFGFSLYKSDEDLFASCAASGYPPDSEDCKYIFYSYKQEIQFDDEVCRRNNNGGVLTLATNCTSCDDSFHVDQNDNIDWFVDTLMSLVGNITN